MDCKMRVEEEGGLAEGNMEYTKIYCFQSNCASSSNQMRILPELFLKDGGEVPSAAKNNSSFVFPGFSAYSVGF